MSYKKQKMIATIVKEKRKTLGYTQQEVSDITKISLRSIQRIEKGTVMPRMHTLKALSELNNLILLSTTGIAVPLITLAFVHFYIGKEGKTAVS